MEVDGWWNDLCNRLPIWIIWIAGNRKMDQFAGQSLLFSVRTRDEKRERMFCMALALDNPIIQWKKTPQSHLSRIFLSKVDL